jgi:TonB family protein
MKKMNIYSKPLQLSLFLHGIIFLALINLNIFPIRHQNFLVIDFSMENEPLSREGGNTTTISPSVKLHKNQENKYSISSARNQQNEEKPIISHEPPDKRDILQKEAHTSVMPISDNNPDTIMGSDASSSLASQTNVREFGLQKTGSSGPSNGGDGDVISSDKSRYMKAHFSYIKDLIYKHLIYPVTAKKMGWEGKVITTFVVSSEGYVKDVRISKSSGHEILDENAVKAIKNASPFPKPPVEAQIIIPILYRLN